MSFARIAITTGVIVVAGLAAAGVAGAVWLPGRDLREVSPATAQSVVGRLADATGARVSVAGPITLRLFPMPELGLDEVLIGDDPQTAFATDHLSMRLGFGDLLGGGLSPRRVVLDGPRLALEEGPEAGAKPTTAAASAAAFLIAGAPDLTIRNGILDLGLGGGRRVLLDGVEAESQALTGGGRELAGRMSAGGVPILLEMRLGSADREGVRAVAGRATLTAGGAAVTYDGRILPGGFDGSIDLRAGDAGVLAGLVSDVSGATTPPPVPFGLPLRLTGALKVDQAGARLTRAEMSLGDSRAEGELAWAPDGMAGGVTARIDLGRFDAGPWIEAASAPGAAAALLGALPASLDLSAASVATGMAAMPALSDLAVTLKRDPRTGGDVLMPAFSVESPAGATRLDAEGRVGQRAGGLGFDGIMTLEARSVSGLIAAFNGGEQPGVAPGRLGRLALRATAALAPGGLGLTDLSGTFDGAEVSGGLSAAWGGPDQAWRLGGRVAFDRLNLDAYLTGRDAVAEADRIALRGLPAHGGGRLRLEAGEAVWRGDAVRDVRVDVTFDDRMAEGVVRHADRAAATTPFLPRGAS